MRYASISSAVTSSSRSELYFRFRSSRSNVFRWCSGARFSPHSPLAFTEGGSSIAGSVLRGRLQHAPLNLVHDLRLGALAGLARADRVASQEVAARVAPRHVAHAAH